MLSDNPSLQSNAILLNSWITVSKSVTQRHLIFLLEYYHESSVCFIVWYFSRSEDLQRNTLQHTTSSWKHAICGGGWGEMTNREVPEHPGSRAILSLQRTFLGLWVDTVRRRQHHSTSVERSLMSLTFLPFINNAKAWGSRCLWRFLVQERVRLEGKPSRAQSIFWSSLSQLRSVKPLLC